jgi:hypothetical protein
LLGLIGRFAKHALGWCRLAEAGLEHPADYPRKTSLSIKSDAKSDALSVDAQISIDRDLAHLAELWPNLPETLKALLLELVGQSSSAR